MKDKKRKASSSDTKKWFFFLLFLVSLVLVYFFFLMPRGESETKKVLHQARLLNQEARGVVMRTNDPQDLANLELSTAALESAQKFIIGSEFPAAQAEAEKSILHSRKIVSKDDPVISLKAKVRFDQVIGTTEVRKTGHSSTRPAKRGLGLEVGDTIVTADDGVCRFYFVSGMETTLAPNGRIQIQDSVSAAQDNRTIYLEKGRLTFDTSDLPSGQTLHVFTDAGNARILPNTLGEMTYEPTRQMIRISIVRGRVRALDGAQELDVLANQRATYLRLENRVETTDLPAPPVLKAPANFAKFEANQNDFAAVPLNWAGSADALNYHLEVSSNPFFTQIVREKRQFAGTRVEFPDLNSGIYYWRVRSISSEQVTGLASQHRQFQIDPPDRVQIRSVDSEPPHLRVSKVDVQGYIVIIRGNSEQDATVWINDEKAIVDDYTGDFSHTASMPGSGVYSLDIVAMDRAGNRTFKEIPVQIKD